MRALVISGGGCKGAWAGGVAEYLMTVMGKKYDIFVGSSTGSLLIPFLANDDIRSAKEVYTGVRQKDIYNVNPFKKSILKNGETHIGINYSNALSRILKRKKTFGEHKNLLKTIHKYFKKEHFDNLLTKKKKVIVTVSNLTKHHVEYKYLKDNSYEDFCEWMWYSSSFVPFMSLGKKNGYLYADGGFGNYIPIEEAVNNGAKEIDVIVLSSRRPEVHISHSKNLFELLLHTLLFSHRQIVYHDILIGQLESIYNKDVKVNFHFTPKTLTPYSFYFDPDQMSQWWEDGYQFAKAKYEG